MSICSVATSHDKAIELLLDRAAIVRTTTALFDPGQVVELRILEAVTEWNPRPHTESGYFDDYETLAEAVAGM